MDDRELQLGRDLRLLPNDRLVGVPTRARDDRRRPGELQPAFRLGHGRAPQEVLAQARDLPVHAPLDRLGGPGPGAGALTPAGPGFEVVVGRLPAAPATFGVSGAEPRHARPLPVRSDEVEARRHGGQRARGLRDDVADDHANRRSSVSRAGRREEQNRCKQKTFHRQSPLDHRARPIPVRQAWCRNPYNREARTPNHAVRRSGRCVLGGRSTGQQGARDPVRARPRGQPGHQGLREPPVSEAEKHYDAAVIVLDTPGGLSNSMRTIYQKELALKVPVIVYVSPSGARAASAGVWIGQAADVLAMAPVSNIGSSTPIDSSGANIELGPAAEGGQRRRRVPTRTRGGAQAKHDLARFSPSRRRPT